MIEFYKHDKEAKSPTRNHSTDAGIDLYALEDEILTPNHPLKIRTGIALNVPEGMVGKIEDRSSLASYGLTISGGVIDHGYSGEILVVMTYTSNYPDMCYEIKKGDKIAQLLLYKVDTTGLMEVKTLWDSDRNQNGFGSSGR